LKNFLYHHFPGIIWVVVILILTCIPGTSFPQIPRFLDLFQPDKLVHVFLFMVLVYLLLIGFQRQLQMTRANRISVLIALNIGIFIGGTTELLQGTGLVIGRHCSVYDFIANVAGCFLGWWIFVLIKRNRSGYLSS
jgi:VanZ family protein